MAFLIDSHCHLDFFKPEEVQTLLDHARDAGLEGMLTIGTRLSEHERQKALARLGTPELKIWCSVGTHPDHAAEEPLLKGQQIAELAQDACVIGIGEAGLDYYHGQPEDYARQKECFCEHIAAARMTGLPLIIHSRQADEDMAALLQEEQAKGAFAFLLHCFTSGAELARVAVALGGYISISGIATFPKAQELRDVLKAVPQDRILVETDSPYLAPVPVRGQRNEPAYVAHVANAVAAFRGLEPEQIRAMTTENFYRLFSRAR